MRWMMLAALLACVGCLEDPCSPGEVACDGERTIGTCGADGTWDYRPCLPDEVCREFSLPEWHGRPAVVCLVP